MGEVLDSNDDVILASNRGAGNDGGDIIFETSGVERGRVTSAGVGTGIFNTPTNSELFASTYWPTNVTVTTSLAVGTAPFGLTLAAASMVLMNGAIAADDTNYWTVELMSWRNTDGNATTVATKTTKVTGGAAIVQRADWNFDSIAFTSATLAKGYTFGFRFTPTGAPSPIAGALMTVRYEPT